MPEQKNNLRGVSLIIFLVIGVYIFYERIFGGSPTDFQFILWIAGFFGVGIYSVNRKIGKIRVGVRNGFSIVKKDIGDINNKSDKLNDNI